MLTALWLVTRDGRRRYVSSLNRSDHDPALGLSPFEARQLAAELTAAADEVDPPPNPTRGIPPYGWGPSSREPVPVLEEMRVIDRMIQHVHEGLTRSESVRELNALGFTTRPGKPWTRDALRQVQLRLIRDGILPEYVARPADRQSQPPLPD